MRKPSEVRDVAAVIEWHVAQTRPDPELRLRLIVGRVIDRAVRELADGIAA